MIEYKSETNGKIRVRLDRLTAGFIVKTVRGYRYIPRGSRTGGDEFPTIREVKASLETDTNTAPTPDDGSENDQSKKTR